MRAESDEDCVQTRAPLRVAIIGAGWAGCAAAIAATRQGHQVTVFEAASTPGGRARTVVLPDGTVLDNGQHIMIGAYRDTLTLMESIGIDTGRALQRLPLDLRVPDGTGLHMPAASFSPQLDVMRAILSAQGWSLADRLSLLRVAARWQWQGFAAPDNQSVSEVCRGLRQRVYVDLIVPLCVSAFNSLPEQTSGAVFLQVLHDAMLAERGGSDVLIARDTLGATLPEPALHWLSQHHAAVRVGHRVRSLFLAADTGWRLDDGALGTFDQVVLAVPAREAARLASTLAPEWAASANALHYAPIATTYAWCSDTALDFPPMQALRDSADKPAQFVFCHHHRTRRNTTGAPATLLAFVTSCCDMAREALEHAVRLQAQEQLGLQHLEMITTVVDRRATFICSPGLQRPPMQIRQGLIACGDYVQGPYPATLEGAVRSGLAAAALLPAP